MNHPDLFVCKNCSLFTPTSCNYGYCGMNKTGGIDKTVYENGNICEMERRIFNNKVLSDRLNGKISHAEMYKKWRKL